MVAGAFVVTVPDAQFLFAMRPAHARTHMEHNASWRVVNAIDPLARQIGSAERFFSVMSQRVSKRPVWLGEAATPVAVLPPTIHCIAGSSRNRSASFTSSYPASRPNMACRNIPTGAWRPFASASIRERLARHRGETERVVESPWGQSQSDVTTESRNWSISRRRSNSGFSVSPFDSSARLAMAAAFKSA
jgi:hypothetical protein